MCLYGNVVADMFPYGIAVADVSVRHCETDICSYSNVVADMCSYGTVVADVSVRHGDS